MNGISVSVCVPGADSATIVSAARLAESFNVDIWIGDPHGRAANCDDTYVTTTAAAVAAVTSHIRIGILLTLKGSTEMLRLAEDIGVVDQASRGRVEIGFAAADGDTALWESRARQLLNAWHEWAVGDDRSVSTTPRPAQPWVSRVIAGGAGAIQLADRLRGGIMLLDESTVPSSAPGLADRRTIIVVAPEPGEGGIREWLADEVLQQMITLRDSADRVGAHEALFLLKAAGPSRLVSDIEALGIVVGTSLRCARHKLEFLAPDAWNWLIQLRHLHHPPE
jgi:Luciferase-like monooxygenase